MNGWLQNLTFENKCMGMKSQACSDVQVAPGVEKNPLIDANESLHLFEFHRVNI
jgi:hypothetical protein